MIAEGILNAVFAVVEGFLRLLPDVSWQVDGSVFDVFFDILEMVCYLLPMGTVVAIFGIVVAFTLFKTIISLARTIWDILPLV